MRCAGEIRLDGAAESVPRARRLVALLAACSDEVRADAELVVAELTSNACLHGQPPVVVRVLESDRCARVEVSDAGSGMPMRPRPNAEAMTGRGFALVAALARSWGVEPARGGGKTVWAEVCADPPEPAAGVGPAGSEVDQLLARWADDGAGGSGEPLFTVQLGAVPTELLLDAKSQVDDVVRELKLVQARAGRGDALPDPLQALVRAVTEDFAVARSSIKRQALESAGRGQLVTELTLHLPLSAADAGERYLAALREVDRYSRAARMLTLAPPRSHRVFREWYLRALIDQLRAVAHGEPAGMVAPFPQVLAAQVDELAALLETQTRLRLLQTLTRRLAESRSVDQMAEVVVDIALEYHGVQTARVFTLDGETLSSEAWRGGPPGGGRYAQFRLDEDIPGAAVVRTGEPIHARSMGELYTEYPGLGAEALYPRDLLVHNVPLRAGGHSLGLLAVTFRAGEVTDEAQREFVSALADALAQAMERARATERADAERSRELALLGAQADALGGVVAGRPLVDVLDGLLLAIEAAAGDGLIASVLLLDSDGQHLRHGSAPSLPGEYNAAIDGLAIGPAVGSCGTAAHRREQVVVTDVTTSPLWSAFRGLAAAAGVRACWSTPIPSSGRAGDLLGTFAVYYRQPRGPSADELAFIDVLVGTVALIIESSRRNDGESGGLRDEAAQRLALELAVTAGGIGIFDWNLVTGELLWDDRLLDIFGLVGQPSHIRTIEDFFAAVHPADRERVAQLLRRSVDTLSDFGAEYRILLPDGSTRWVAAHGRCVPGAAGRAIRLVGAAQDTTVRRDSEARVARAMDSLATAFFFVDREWRFTFVNAEAERVLGRKRTELVGRVMWAEFPATVGSDFERHYRHAADSGEPVAFDAYYPEPLHAWYEVRAWPSPDGLAVYFLDVTDRRAAQESAQRAINRAGLLARVSEELARTDEPGTAMRSLAQVVVPELGEWCVVTLIGDDRHAGTRRGLGEAVGWHADPAMRERVERYAGTRLAVLADGSMISRAVETAQAQIVNGEAMTALRSMFTAGSEPLRLLEELDAFAVAVLPLVGQEDPVGMLSVVNTRARGPFDAEEIGLLRDIAARAGLVLDRARLFRQQRSVAEVLQRSMLRSPQRTAVLDVADRYVAAAEAARVGGDWYDTVDLDGGATAVVIGDVMGHDVLAAAAMGEARTLVRTVAVQHDGAPGPTLDDVERVMPRLRLDTLATVLVGRLEPVADGSAMRFTFANAGHPPPLLVRPDREVVVLGEGVVDPLLGMGSAAHAEHVVSLPAGSLLVLYTDGLVERRGQSIDAGIERLGRELTELYGADPRHVCDEVISRLVPARPEDDVALLVVQVLPTAGGAPPGPRTAHSARPTRRG